MGAAEEKPLISLDKVEQISVNKHFYDKLLVIYFSDISISSDKERLPHQICYIVTSLLNGLIILN